MQRLGRYELEEQLGQGGMAVVWRARDTHVGRQVAVKVPAAILLHDPAARARFQREIALAGQLQHPRIVPIYDVNIDSDPPFLVMPLLPGGSLTQRLKTGPLLLADALRVTAQIAQALDEAHRHGIIHRDLKPSNILFDQRGDAALADFGISRALSVNQEITRTGVMGTPAYMSPEQLRDGPLDGRADQYGLGIVAYEMLIGRLPFEGSTAQIIQQHLSSPLPGLGDQLPAGLRAALARATAKTAEARYPSAGAFAAALEQASREPAGPESARRETALPPLPPLPAPLEPIPTTLPPGRITATVGDAHGALPASETPSPNYLGRLYSDGRRALEAGDWEKAQQLLEQVAVLQPGYRETDQLLERVRAELGQPPIPQANYTPGRPPAPTKTQPKPPPVAGATKASPINQNRAARQAVKPSSRTQPRGGLAPKRSTLRPVWLTRRMILLLAGLLAVPILIGAFALLALGLDVFGGGQASTATATNTQPTATEPAATQPLALSSTSAPTDTSFPRVTTTATSTRALAASQTQTPPVTPLTPTSTATLRPATATATVTPIPSPTSTAVPTATQTPVPADPITPTSTDAPTFTPETPTSTPETPTSTPETPTSTPETPTSTPPLPPPPA
jgi:serine/threonine-protein kinase